MENIITAQPVPEDNSPNPKLPPPRDAVINQQVGTLLHIVGICSGNLALLNSNEVAVGENGGRTDGGPRMALATTLVQANDRLQSILSNPHCWDIGERQTLEQHAVEVFELKKSALRASLQPHVRFKPSFQWLPNFNKWLVWVGDLRDPNGHVLGLGDDVERAIEAFDRAFTQQRAEMTINQSPEQHEQNDNRVDPRKDQPASPVGGRKDTCQNHRPAARSRRKGGKH